MFTNGVVFTVNEEQPEAKAVAVSGNKIVFVGPSIEVSSMIGEGRQFLKTWPYRSGTVRLPPDRNSSQGLTVESWETKILRV